MAGLNMRVTSFDLVVIVCRSDDGQHMLMKIVREAGRIFYVTAQYSYHHCRMVHHGHRFIQTYVCYAVYCRRITLRKRIMANLVHTHR